MFSPGIEPGTFCVLDRCDNRYTTKTDWEHVLIFSNLFCRWISPSLNQNKSLEESKIWDTQERDKVYSMIITLAEVFKNEIEHVKRLCDLQ